MIVRNESRFLAECLRSAAPFVAEMIVVDTGSTDDTAAIASAWGAAVIHAAWEDDFAGARNLSLAAAAQPWILVLDADERLVVGDAAAWQASLDEASKWGYFVKVNSYVGNGASEEAVTDAVCRLFRRDGRIRFRGLVHEETATAIGEAFGGEAIGYAKGVEIWHEGYRDEVIAERDKFARNRRLLDRALAAAPDDPSLRYAAGAELFASGEYGAALAWLEPLARMEQDPGYGSDVALKVIHACRAVGRLRDAEQYASMAARRYADFADAHEARGEVLLALDEPLLALRSAEAALAAGPAPACYSTAAGAGTYRAHVLVGAALERLYRFRGAAEAYRAAMAQRSDYAPAWQRLLLLGKLDESLRPLWPQPAAAGPFGGDAVEAGRTSTLRDAGAGAVTGAEGCPCACASGMASAGERTGARLQAALQAALAAGGAGQSPPAAGQHRLTAGWAAAARGEWLAAAAGFAAAQTAGARPWQCRAAAAGLAAAGAALARAAGADLPALYSETALPLILGTAVNPPA